MISVASTVMCYTHTYTKNRKGGKACQVFSSLMKSREIVLLSPAPACRNPQKASLQYPYQRRTFISTAHQIRAIGVTRSPVSFNLVCTEAFKFFTFVPKQKGLT